MKTIEECPHCGLEVAFDAQRRAETLCPRCENPLQRQTFSDGGARVELVPADASYAGGAVPLVCGTHLLGRKSAMSSATIQFDVQDFFMSKRHTQINVAEDAYGQMRVTVRDAGSSNGTYVNERRLAPAEEVTLSSGDKLRMGNTRFNVRIN